MRFNSISPQATSEVASKILDTLKPNSKATVLALSGDLGAGKTTLTKGFANALGILDIVNSPTFNILKKYSVPDNKLFKHLVHIDAYRLANSHDLISIGFSDLIRDPSNLIIIEWPERVVEILPPETLNIQINHIDIDTREIILRD